MPTKDKAKIVKEIELLEDYGIELRPPKVWKIRGARYAGLWELRVSHSSNNYRIFYFLYDGGVFILLHGFIKKKDKTDKRELEIAKSRMDKYIKSRR